MLDWKVERWPVGCCSRCRGVIYDAPFRSLSEFGDFCSRECRDANKATRAGGRPKLNKRDKLAAKAARKVYERDYKRASRASVSTNNPLQLVESK